MYISNKLIDNACQQSFIEPYITITFEGCLGELEITEAEFDEYFEEEQR